MKSPRKYIRNFIAAYIVKRYANSSPIHPPVPKHAKKILLVSYDAIGDIILSVPTMKALRAYFTDARFDVVCSPRNALLVEHYRIFDHIYVLSLNEKLSIFGRTMWRKLKQIRQNNYDAVINIFDEPNVFAMAKILRLTDRSGILYSLPLRYKDTAQQKLLHRQRLFQRAKQIDEMYFGERMASIQQVLGITLKVDTTLTFPFPSSKVSTISEQHFNVLFNPAGSQPNNKLSTQSIQQILEILSRQANVCLHLFNNTAQDVTFLGQCTRHKTANIIDAAGILQHMDLVISTDTSIAHIALAANKPLVVIRNSEMWRNSFDPRQGDYQVIKSPSHNINDFDFDRLATALKQYFPKP
jgi:ADP-heptose:LPS heptosyltransferase